MNNYENLENNQSNPQNFSPKVEASSISPSSSIPDMQTNGSNSDQSSSQTTIVGSYPPASTQPLEEVTARVEKYPQIPAFNTERTSQFEAPEFPIRNQNSESSSITSSDFAPGINSDATRRHTSASYSSLEDNTGNTGSSVFNPDYYGTDPLPNTFAESGFNPTPEHIPPRTEKSGKRKPGWIATFVIALLCSIGTFFGSQYLPLGEKLSMEPEIATSTPVVQGSAKNTDWETVAKTVSSSVVSIQVSNSTEADTGSGVVFDNAGHVLTNYHVIAPGLRTGGKVRIALDDGNIYRAEIVGYDTSTDLAVLKFAENPGQLKMASLGDSNKLKVAQPVAAVGSPLGLENTVTTGIISALDRPVQVKQSKSTNPTAADQLVVTNAIQVDAAINPGNSGGPLFDSSGRVIGITSSIASLSNGQPGAQAGSIGIGFAIPVNLARNIADQILKQGYASHAKLGVMITSGEISSNGRTIQGALVQEVQPDTAAAKAGIKAKDLITRIDGKRVGSGTALTGYVRWYKPGNTVSLEVYNQSGKHEVKVTLEAIKEKNQ